MNTKKLLNFFFELGQLKMIEHEGWRLAGINHPESVASHSLRAAQIGYVKDINALWHQVEEKNTTAGVLAKDADYLEQAITAKEYMEKGHAFAENWIDNISKGYLKTFSAQKLLADLRKADSNDWWQGLKKL